MAFDVNGGNRAKIPVVVAFTLRKLTWLFFLMRNICTYFNSSLECLFLAIWLARICFTLIDPDQIHTYANTINPDQTARDEWWVND